MRKYKQCFSKSGYWMARAIKNKSFKNIPTKIRKRIGYTDWLIAEGVGDYNGAISVLVEDILKEQEALK